ncbi:MAG TPA: caspase family protein [Ilumatobacter sp.]|nr:caspase family protein [Ilumatobacter sp.]
MKRALCVGINDYPVKGADLKGCVNDAKAWAALLIDHFGFDPQNVTMLIDSQATKKRVLAAVDKLVADAKKGDVLVFTNSSHGTYVADRDGDETRYDEAMCPYDMKKNLILDDELRQRFAGIADGVRLTVISDSCHSGSVTRGEVLDTPDDRRRRFVNPRTLGLPEIQGVRRKAKPRTTDVHPERRMREVLVSGCRDNQYSYDARINGTYHGAMTYYALRIIEQANYDLSYEELWDQLVERLEIEGYDQEPQVEGKSSNKRRRLFT